VTDIETTVRTMQQDGMSFRNTITQGPGGAQILADDPFGNPIEIFQAK
jgi:glyoxylase I family protein